MVGYIGFDPGANSSVTRVRTTTSPTSAINHSDLDGSTSIYLPFDSDVNDDSSHGHTGQAFGDATISSTQSKWGGNSLYLDGSDVVRYSTDNAMKLYTEDFTIEAWVYRTSNVSYGTVVARWDSAGNNRSYIARFNGHTPYFYYSTNGSSYTERGFSGVTTSLNTWHHVAWVRRNDYLYFYLDGVESSSVYNMSGANLHGANEAKFSVGAINSTPSGHLSAANFFAGYIDDLRIIKGKGLYSGAFTPPAAAVGVHNSYPVSLYLPFDSDIQDDSTHAHTVTASGDAAVSSAQSKFGGNSLALDGTGDYLSVSADTDFRTDDEFTLEGWARASSLSGFNTIIEQKSTDTTETFTLGIENNYLKATQVTTEAADWLFNTSLTGNSQTYSGNARSITSSGGGLGSSSNDTTVTLSAGETAYYVIEFTVQNLRNRQSFSVGWIASGGSNNFSRNGQSNSWSSGGTVPWGTNGSGSSFQVGLRPLHYLSTSATLALGIKLTKQDSGVTGSGELFFFVNGVDKTDTSTSTLSEAEANALTLNGFKFGAVVWDNNEWSIGPAGATSGYLSSYATAMGGTPDLGVVTTASSTSITQTSGKTISTDEWFHYALGFNNGTVEIFHDGAKVSSGSSPTSSSAKAITIGASSSGENTFAGYLDDIRFSRVTRYTKSFVPPSAAVGATLNGTNETNTTTEFTSLYLPFDSDLNDDSNDSVTVTVNGDATVSSTQSKFGGSSLHLDGTGDFLTVPKEVLLLDNASYDFTVEMWVYPTTLVNGRLWSQWGGGSNRNFLIQTQSDGDVQVYIRSSGGTESQVTSSGGLTVNTWAHVAVVRAGQKVILFIDGVEKGSIDITGNLGSYGSAIGIGARGDTAAAFFEGYIDDLRVLKGYAKYTADFSPPSSAVGTSVSETNNDLAVLYMPFDDYLNETARNHSVEKVGDVSLNASIKKFGTHSAYFDGTTDRLIVQHRGDLNLQNHDFTIEGWFYLADASEPIRLVYSTGGTGTRSGWLIYATNTAFQFWASSVTNAWNIASGSSLGARTNSAWVHLAVTREGNTFRCFQNGTQTSTFTSGKSLYTDPGEEIAIGGWAGGGNVQYLNGYIDDLRIIKGKAIYTEAFTPPTEAVGPQVQGGGVTTTTRTVDKKNLGSIWTLNRGSGKTSGKSFLNQRRRGRWRRSQLKGVAGHRHYSQPSGNATGGDITVSGGIVRHVFSAPLTTNPGPIESSVDATGVFTMPGTLQDVDVTIEIVGGGGGGGSGPGQWGGSGAGGAYLRATYNGPYGSFPVTAGKQGLGHGRQHGQGHRASSGGSTTAFGFEVAGGSGGVGANPAGPPSRGIGGTVTDSSGIAGTTLVTSASGNDGVGAPGSTTGGTGGWSSSPYGAPVWGAAGAAPGSNYTRGNDATGYGNGGSSAGSAQNASSGTDRWAGDGSPGAVIISYPDAYRS